LEELQFIKLCEACDKLLLEQGVQLERVALPWLHVIREHPVFLKEYKGIVEDKIISKDIVSFSAGVFFKSLFNLRKILVKNTNYWAASHKKKQTTDVLFVSHLVRDSHAGKNADFYFSNLADKLNDEGYKSAFALINHTEVSGQVLAEKWKSSKVPRYILSDVIGFIDELRFQLNSNIESIKLKRIAAASKDALLTRIAYKAAYELRQGRSIQNLRIGKQILMLVKELNPRLIVATYEGHAWERVVFSQARNAKPSIRCVGYQHAAIFRLQHAIRRNLEQKFNPDCILTAGEISFQQLKESNLLGVSLSILGSDRGVKNNVLEETKKPSRACLVIPEGFMSECILLFSFALACAKEMPQVKFIWRLHPLISFEAISKEMDLDKLPSNIVVSTFSIEKDIDKCTWVLYRGSTAIIQAINSGLVPLYHDDGSIIIDPIYKVNSLHLHVRSVRDFLMIVSNPNEDYLKSEIQLIQNYSKDFFTPLNCRILIEQISSSRSTD